MRFFFQKNKNLVALYLAFHGAILLAILISLFFGRSFSIDADLFHMLPSSTLGEAMGKADEKLSDSTAKNVFVLVGHEDFSRAKETAENVFKQLDGNDNFTSLSLYAGANAVHEIEEFVAQYRWRLLSDDMIALLSADGGAAEFAQESLSRAFSSFTLTSLSHIEEDPFLLDELNTQQYLISAQEASTKMQPRDGVLASQYEGVWYVMIRGALSSKGSAIASHSNGITSIYSVCAPLEKDGIRFMYSGTPFHSHKSSNSAVTEIGTISTISLSIVIIMLILIFRSPLPLFASVASIFISMGAAFAATMLAFGHIHILTLILGTSLIGSSIDYSLHYFVNWKAHSALKSTAEIRAHLFKGLFLSMLSTEICYCLLIFAPFAILRQMGVFSSTGILSSFLTVICLYPLFPLPRPEKRKISALRFFKDSPIKKIGGPRAAMIISLALIFIFALIITIFHKNLRIENNMFRLYSMEGRVKEDTELCTKITGYYPQSWFIISGNTEEELLQNEEKICRELDRVQERGYLATSRFIPSLKKQEESAAAARNLLPFAQEQFLLLGFDESDAENFLEHFNSALSKKLLPSETLPSSLTAITNMLWLGEIDGKFYSIILPVKIVDEKAYTSIAAASDFAYYENKMKDLGLGLDHLTRLAAVLFCIAYAIILIVLKRFYTWRQTAKIASLPLMCVLLIVSVFLIIGQAVEFFSLTGIILVFGLGLDYIIYMIENIKREKATQNAGLSEEELKNSRLEPFAITLSFLTTAISFGALIFSTFVPVHTIGLTITLGLVAAFVCTMI